MRILSLSSVYPNPLEPGLGLFVRSRLAHLARLAELKVVAPVAVLDYSHPKGKCFRRRDVPLSRIDECGEVFHPRWIFPPGGTPANVLCLAARLFPTIARLRKTFRFDLIDAHFGYPEGAAAAVLASIFRVPFMVTLRGNEPVFAADRSRRYVMAAALRRASAVVAVSRDLARFAVQLGAPADRVHTIPNGIDTDLFHPRDRESCRRIFGIGRTTRLIVSAGELIEAKGHHLAIQSVAALVSQGIDVQLVIAGGVARGGRRFDQQLRQSIQSLGIEDRTRMAGPLSRDGMAGLLTAADVFTLPSYMEGCPNVVIEALACGTPVVASAVGAIPEMLSATNLGMVVPARDQASLTTALLRAIQTEWDRDAISSHGRSRSWDVVALEVLNVIEKLCAVSAGSSITIATAS